MADKTEGKIILHIRHPLNYKVVAWECCLLSVYDWERVNSWWETEITNTVTFEHCRASFLGKCGCFARYLIKRRKKDTEATSPLFCTHTRLKMWHKFYTEKFWKWYLESLLVTKNGSCIFSSLSSPFQLFDNLSQSMILNTSLYILKFR